MATMMTRHKKSWRRSLTTSELLRPQEGVEQIDEGQRNDQNEQGHSHLGTPSAPRHARRYLSMISPPANGQPLEVASRCGDVAHHSLAPRRRGYAGRAVVEIGNTSQITAVFSGHSAKSSDRLQKVDIRHSLGLC